MKDKIVLSRKGLSKLTDEAGKLVLKKTAEIKLLELLQLQKDIEEFIDQVKLDIVEAGRKISPDFKGVVGGRVKAYLRKSGFKYAHDKKLEDKLKPYLTEVFFYRPNSEKIDEYKESNKTLPEGITENERIEKLVFVVKEDTTPALP